MADGVISQEPAPISELWTFAERQAAYFFPAMEPRKRILAGT